MSYHIIVTCLPKPEWYQLEERIGDLPHNFVCYAPENEVQRQAIADDLAEGSQTLITAWVDSQLGQDQ